MIEERSTDEWLETPGKFSMCQSNVMFLKCQTFSFFYKRNSLRGIQTTQIKIDGSKREKKIYTIQYYIYNNINIYNI